jgi:hypothetical protein
VITAGRCCCRCLVLLGSRCPSIAAARQVSEGRYGFPARHTMLREGSSDHLTDEDRLRKKHRSNHALLVASEEVIARRI